MELTSEHSQELGLVGRSGTNQRTGVFDFLFTIVRQFKTLLNNKRFCYACLSQTVSRLRDNYYYRGKRDERRIR